MDTNNTPATKEDVKQIVTESLGEFAKIMSKSFDAVNQRFEGIDRRFEGIDGKFDAIDQRFDAIDRRFDGIDRKFEDVYKYIDQSIEKSAEETRRHFDVVAENIHVDVARANKDEILSIKQRVKVLEERIGV